MKAILTLSVIALNVYLFVSHVQATIYPLDLKYSCIEVTTNKTENKGLTPVLLLHGLGLSKENWMGIYQVLALETKRKICIADARNHGDSPRSANAGVDIMSKDVIRLLDTLKMPKVILLGHSMGGKVALHTALKYPKRVEKLIVEDMRPNKLEPEALKFVRDLMGIFKKALTVIPDWSSEQAAKDIVTKYVNERLKEKNILDTLIEKRSKYLPLTCPAAKCKWKANTIVMAKVLLLPHLYFSKSSGVYNGPALFIYGTKSPFKVGNDKEIQKMFPNAKLVPIEGASHVIHEHFHKEFMEEVLKFLKE